MFTVCHSMSILGESLFNPSMSCYSCSEAVGIHDCGNQAVQICQSNAVSQSVYSNIMLFYMHIA